MVIVDPLFGHLDPPTAPLWKPRGGKLLIDMSIDIDRRWFAFQTVYWRNEFFFLSTKTSIFPQLKLLVCEEDFGSYWGTLIRLSF